MIKPAMKLQHKAWLPGETTIGVLTLASVLVSQHSITAAFDELENDQYRVEGVVGEEASFTRRRKAAPT